MQILKIGVIGAGHLGKIHLRLLAEIPQVLVAGFYDPDHIAAALAEAQTGAKCHPDLHSLLAAADAVVIATPTAQHYQLAAAAMEQGKHVFIEKPMTATISEAARLRSLVQRHRLKLQVGHVERFNPAFTAIAHTNLKPLFIEAHRLANYNPRGTDVSVVMDLMIHDIDLVLCLVPSAVSQVHATGAVVVSDSADIANARIEFENGCVANLTASRVSLTDQRRMRIFQPDAYLSLDFLARQTQRITLAHDPPADQRPAIEVRPTPNQPARYLLAEQLPTAEANAIKTELSLFAQSIQHNQPEVVTVNDGFRAVELAHRIMSQIPKRRP